MKNKIIFYSLLIICMPFWNISCAKDGYTIGFPAALAKIWLNPVEFVSFYPWGLLNFILLPFAFFLYRLIAKNKIALGTGFITGAKFVLSYIILHAFFNLLYPIFLAYSIFGRDLLCWIGCVVYPYLYLMSSICKISVYENLTVFIRLNFIASLSLYFLLGVVFERMLNLINKNRT